MKMILIKLCLCLFLFLGINLSLHAQGPVRTMDELILRRDEEDKAKFRKPDKVRIEKLDEFVTKLKHIEKMRYYFEKDIIKTDRELNKNIRKNIENPKNVKNTLDTIRDKIGNVIESYGERFIIEPEGTGGKKWTRIFNGYINAIYETIYDEFGNSLYVYTFNISFGEETPQQSERGTNQASRYDIAIYSPDKGNITLYSYKDITYKSIGDNVASDSYEQTIKTVEATGNRTYNSYTKPEDEWNAVSQIIDGIKSEDTYQTTYKRLNTDYYTLEDEKTNQSHVYGEEKSYKEEIISNAVDYTTTVEVSDLEYIVREKTSDKKQDEEKVELKWHVKGQTERELSIGFGKEKLIAKKREETTGLGGIKTINFSFNYEYNDNNSLKKYEYTKEVEDYEKRKGTLTIGEYDANGSYKRYTDDYTSNGINYHEEVDIISRDPLGRITSKKVILKDITNSTQTETTYSNYVYDFLWMVTSYDKTVKTTAEGITTTKDYRITDIEYYENGLEKSLVELNITDNIRTLILYKYNEKGRLIEEIDRALNLTTNEYTYTITRYTYHDTNQIATRDRVVLTIPGRTDYPDYYAIVNDILNKLIYTGGETYTSYSISSTELSQWGISTASSLLIYKIRGYVYEPIADLTEGNYTSGIGRQGATNAYDQIKRTITITSSGTVSTDTIELTLFR